MSENIKVLEASEAEEETQVVTPDEVKAYLGIDYTDDFTEKNIERAIKSADLFLRGSIGDDYPVEDSRAKDLALIVVADLFDNRGLQAQGGGTVSSNIRRLVEDFSLQMRLELRRANEDG